MKLTGLTLKRLRDALLDAFPSQDALAQMVRFGLNENLEAIAGLGALKKVVFSLLTWAEANNRLDALLSAAREDNPGSESLRRIVEEIERSSAPRSDAPPRVSGVPPSSLGASFQTQASAVGEPPISTFDAEEHFRQAVVRRFDRLAIRLPSVAHVELPLEDIYVDLKVVAEIPDTADTFGPVERRIFAELDGATESERLEKLRQLDDLKYRRWRRPEGVSASFLESALDRTARASRPLVILGDPGSGKSTALQLMALRAARDGRVSPQDSTPRHGPWVPLLVRLAAYDQHLETKKEPLALECFLSTAWSAHQGTADLNALFSDALRAGRALVLLDGLDEVLTHARRSYVNEQVKALIGTWAPLGNRFVITSRFVGYREASLSGVADEVSVVDFGLKDIERFLKRWYEVIDGPGGGKRSKALFNQINQTPRLRELAANPLMLSMLATLQSKRGDDERLPERRVELYQEFTEMMLSLRPEARSDGARIDGVPRTDPTTMRAHLSDLALWLHLNRPSNTATPEDVLKALAQSYLKYNASKPTQPTPKEKLQAEREAKKLLEELRGIAGLIGERGHDAHGFLHLTYQEFFAARAVAEMPPDGRWDVLRQQLHDPRWREVVLLCAAHLDTVSANDLVQRVLNASSEYETVLHRDVLLASTIVTEEARVSASLHSSIHEKLVALLRDDIAAVRNRAINDIAGLARLGVEKSIAFLAEILECNACALPDEFGSRVYDLVSPLLAIPHCKRLLDIMLRQLEDYSTVQADFSHFAMAFRSIVRANDEVRARLVRLLLREGAAEIRLSVMRCLERLIDEDDDVWEAFWVLAKSTNVSQPATYSIAMHCSSPAKLCRLLDTHWWQSPNSAMRSALIPAIAKVARANREWLRELVGCVDYRDFNTRTHAVSYLGAMAAEIPEAKQAVLHLLETADSYTAQNAIGRLPPTVKDDIEVRRAISAMLSRNFSDVRESELLAMDSAAFHAEVQKLLTRKFVDPGQMREEKNRSLVEPAVQQSDQQAILRLLDDVRSDWKSDRIDTVAPLVAVDEKIVSDVESCLDDPNPFARAAAINALAPILLQKAELRAHILARIEDESPLVCHAAMRALAGIVDEDGDARTAIVRITTQSDEQKSGTAAESLAKAIDYPEVRAALLRLLEGGDQPGKIAAARVLSTLVPQDFEVRDQFRGLAADLAAGRVDADDSWTVLEMLDSVIERDEAIVKIILAQLKSYDALLLVVRHAAAVNLHVGDLDSWLENNPQLFNAVARGMVGWYGSKPSVRRYVLRNIGEAAFSEGTMERLMPLIPDDDDLRRALVQRATRGSNNSGGDVDVLARLIPYVKTCPDVDSSFRELLEQRASETFGYLRQMLAAAGLSGLTGREPNLQTRLLPWLGARIPRPEAAEARKIMAQSFASVLTQENVSLRAKATEMLDSRAWQDRQGAAWMFIYAPGDKSFDLLEKLRSLLYDDRSEESWSRRLQLAGLVLNHKEVVIARRALAVTQEALGYGKTPWHGPLGDEVRTHAANVLGRLEPTHRDSALIDLIVAALKEERSESTRDALYHSLLQLVAAAEPRAA
ncbi:hypothetical protein BE21_18355 [Sorangium cellulosum]|uniref:NACHT domain-containing protein n=1 Tax=Sorangium cellulosum TaxID=56 RepID=A0A150TXE3_SORCE|nr:hypothetical protein BE21_18355 [Sorangium cellulosum]